MLTELNESGTTIAMVTLSPPMPTSLPESAIFDGRAVIQDIVRD